MALLPEDSPNQESMLTLPGDSTQTIVSCNYYESAGSPAVDLFDNPVLGWLVNSVTGLSSPVILGTKPPAVADPMSPQWVLQIGGDVYVPDVWRGTPLEFFTWV